MFFTKASQGLVRQALSGWDKKACIHIHFIQGVKDGRNPRWIAPWFPPQTIIKEV